MTQALIIDALLTFGFGVQHSIIAALGFKRLILKYFTLDAMQWRSIQSVINVNYILIAACLWQPTDYVIYELSGWAAIAMCVPLVIGWIWYFESHIFEYDCGQAFGCSAMISRIFGLEKPKPEMWNVLGRRWIRFPVHTAFFPMFLCFPTMTADLLVFGLVANFGNVIGTIFYDKRLIKMVGKPYQDYIDRTNLISPFMSKKKRRGAIDLDLPQPIMFKDKSVYIDAIVIGLGLGYLHYYFIGLDVQGNFASVYRLAGFSVIAAISAGILSSLYGTKSIGKRLRDGKDNQFLTLLGTKSAIISALSVVSYFVLCFTIKGAIPPFYIILPLWLIVLWLTNFISAAMIIKIGLSQKEQVKKQLA